MKKTVLFISVLAYGYAAVAQDSQSCALIENAHERLACFDQQFPRPDGAAALPRITSQPVRPPSTLGQRPATAPEFSSVQSTRQQTAPTPLPERPRGLFDFSDSIDLDSQIVAVRSGDQQRMVFRLANGQIWMQNSPRNLPIKSGDQVNIKSGFLGGYMLRTENGTATRVRRIQ